VANDEFSFNAGAFLFTFEENYCIVGAFCSTIGDIFINAEAFFSSSEENYFNAEPFCSAIDEIFLNGKAIFFTAGVIFSDVEPFCSKLGVNKCILEPFLFKTQAAGFKAEVICSVNEVGCQLFIIKKSSCAPSCPRTPNP